MKSVLLLASATLAAGAGIAIDVALKPPGSGNVLGGCDVNTAILSEEQCYAAAVALRAADELGPDTSDHDNHPFPQLEASGAGWGTMPKGCVVWNGMAIHYNDGTIAGTGELRSEVTNTICLLHDPAIRMVPTVPDPAHSDKIFGLGCVGYAEIQSKDQCLLAAQQLEADYQLHGKSLGLSGSGDTPANLFIGSQESNYAQVGCYLYKYGAGEGPDAVLNPDDDYTHLFFNAGDSTGTNCADKTGVFRCPAATTHSICSSGKVWEANKEPVVPIDTLAVADCDVLSDRYQDINCCTDCVA